MGSIAELQEATLVERAGEERRYGDLLYYYGTLGALDKMDALLGEIDPKNKADLLIFELFQGTSVSAVMPMLDAEAEAWVRYSLLKAVLKGDDFGGALDIWKKSLHWRNADLLLANTLIPYALNTGRFDEANSILAGARNLAPDLAVFATWQAEVSARQAIDRELHLDPMPRNTPVAFFLTTRGAEAFLEQTLGGIAAQNHPVSEIIVVDDGAMAGLAALEKDYALRVISGDGDMPGDIAAECFAMLPPTAAPALDYVQQFLLAIENSPEAIGRASGRIEDFYQDTPGDNWRVIRMTSTAPQNRVVGPDAPNYGATFKVRATPAGATNLYLPEAVACGLRQDTVGSALTAFWQEKLPARQEAGHFNDVAALVKSFDKHLERCIAFINDDVDEGRTSLVFPDFLTLFHAVALDCQLALAQGLVDEGTAAYIQQQVIQSIGDLDKEYKRNLTQKVRDTLKDRIIASTAAPNLMPEASQLVNAFVQDLHTLYNGMPQDLYLAING